MLCTSSRVLFVVQNMWEKPTKRYMNDVLNTHRVIKTVLRKITSTSVLKCGIYLSNIISLGLALFSNGNNIENADNRSRISSFIDNTNIIGRCKNFNVLFFKEALKINERKPALNTGLKVFK